MRHHDVIASCVLAFAIAAMPVSAMAQQSKPESEKPLAQFLYKGIRTSDLLGSPVFSKKGEHLGRVRNVVLADDGSVKAIISEQAGIGITPEFVFRLPWDKVVQPVRPGVLVADLSDARSHQFGLFAQDTEKKQPDFLVTEVLGDYARLQPGLGYGYVRDVVIAPEGRMIAVLVARDATMGGGTVAFPYPGRTGRWSPEMSYYGLPFVTVEQANNAALKVDAKQFETGG